MSPVALCSKHYWKAGFQAAASKHRRSGISWWTIFLTDSTLFLWSAHYWNCSPASSYFYEEMLTGKCGGEWHDWTSPKLIVLLLIQQKVLILCWCLSSPAHKLCKVPQGSILGPILFSPYIFSKSFPATVLLMIPGCFKPKLRRELFLTHIWIYYHRSGFTHLFWLICQNRINILYICICFVCPNVALHNIHSTFYDMRY